MKKAIILARGYNIAGQVQECREYAKERGYIVTGIVVSYGRELPNVLNGLDEAIDVVIVRDMSRLSRNALENYTVLSELELDYGVTVESATAKTRNEIEERLMQNIIKAVRDNDVRERIKLNARMRPNN